ncbi:hypothetical protein F3J09_29145 [Bacillus sp. Ab-1751]|uniref:hypothetical protein n=1 Tax=Bacillus sp. Ab-1751 TaxID=2608326 RepID=UPI00142237BB|nr:hypothetical protein [Bacillus sp. Ab-1751]
MQRRSFITSKLRPYIRGTKINRRQSPINEGENLNQMVQVSPTILIIASEEDGTASYFKEFVQQNGYSAEFMCLEDQAFLSKFTWSTQVVSYQDTYPGIYIRSASSKSAKINEIISVMQDVLAFYPGVVINRPSRLSLNISKPLQMKAIAGSSNQTVKPIPTFLSNVRTNIGTTPANETIVKSISYVRSKVVTLNDERLLHGEGALSCPIQMQPKLQGVCIRAHVCGEAVYAVRIDGEEVDYRYAEKINMTEFELPQDVETWCLQAARSEGLELAGIDFIYEEAVGLFWCLEINPAPGYHWFEKHLVDSGGVPSISRWLLQRLLG